MQICYLMLVHRSPDCFGRLVQALSGDNTKFFIHVDGKSAIEPFTSAIKENGLGHQSIFIKQRVRAGWGEYSLVQATLNLMADALRHAPESAYFYMVSGSDYPVASPQHIEKFFMDNQGSEFIHLRSVLDCPDLQRKQYISRRLTPHTGWIGFRARVFRRLGFKQPYYEKYLKGMTPYEGSQWWSLSKAACQYIMDFVKHNPSFIRFFKTTRIPDECFFHTIIGNSPYKNKIKPSTTYKMWGEGPISIDFLETLRQGDIFMNHYVRQRGEILMVRKLPESATELRKEIDRLYLRRF